MSWSSLIFSFLLLKKLRFVSFNEFPGRLSSLFVGAFLREYVCPVKKIKNPKQIKIPFKPTIMKKITFILFALIAGTTFAQDSYTAKAEATASAEIIQPITITKNLDLNFGRVIGTSAGGTVTVGATDASQRTASNNNLLDQSTAGETNISSGKFTITAAENYSYNIVVPASVTLAGTGGDPMIVSLNPVYGTTALSAANPKGTATNEILYLGGELAVGTNQGQGQYSADFDVTVTYE